MVYDLQRDRLVLHGGKSRETWEWIRPEWVLASTKGPTEYRGHAMAYDLWRGKTILYGGYKNFAFLSDETWEWDGKTWVLAATGGPGRRRAPAMAFDAKRGRTVLFGGYDGRNYRSETWEWDGKTWSPAGSTGPAPREGAGMVYDLKRGKIVLFGGYSYANNKQIFFDDTWEWNGKIWKKVDAGVVPGRRDMGMAYDSRRGKVVLFGGYSKRGSGGDVYFGDTWEWDGKAWLPVAKDGPAGRSRQGMAYDARLGKTVLFGGASYDPKAGAKTWGDMWTWDGARWSPVVFQDPSIREKFGMAYDPKRRKVVLYGGIGGRVLSDTWEWDGVTWKDCSPSSGGPGPLTGHSMAFDGTGVILFGGSSDKDNKKCKGETWRWDGQTWTMVSSTGPNPRAFSSMVFDKRNKWVVLFGGTTYGQGDGYGDTWIWNGRTWTLASTRGPSGRSSSAMAYDERRGKIVLFGGKRYSPLADTWEWDGSHWVPRAVKGPIDRAGPAMAYDPRRCRIVLYGGYRYYPPQYPSNTWEWDGNAWTRLSIPAPGGRAWHSMVYDGVSGNILLFGAGGGTFAYEWENCPCARFQQEGKGCRGSNGRIPVLEMIQPPRIGGELEFRLKEGPPLAWTFLLLGLKKTRIDLGSLGAPGCSIQAAPELGFLDFTNPGGFWSLPRRFRIPGEYDLLGATFHLQVVLSDFKANPLGLTVTGPVRVVMGF